MNAANVAPDPGSKALLDFLEGRGATAPSQRAILTPDLRNVRGIRGAGAPRVALRMDGADAWSVEIEHGRVGFLRASSNTRIFGRPEVLEAIIKGTASGVEAFLQGQIKVRGNIAMSLQIEGLFASRRRPKRFPTPAMVRAQGVDTFYLEAGSGKTTVVLLHGLGATNASMLPTLWDLARDHHVLAPDLPGFGESGKPVRRYDFPFFASWLRDFLDQAGVKKAILVGNSLGGRISLEAGLMMPERVESMVLLCPSPAFIRGRGAIPLVKALRPEMALVPMLLGHAQVAQVARSLFAQPDRLPGGWYDAFADEFLRVFRSPRGRVAFFSAARQVYLEPARGELGFWDRLPRMHVPALFVWGEKDWLVPARFEHHVTRALPNSESVVLDDCGHVPQYEFPELTNQLIRDFIGARTIAA
ncbi:MAG TPA: alpha/beta fold hydrolase [Candidatus Dormibacteraeota bacterium]|nr:alpha/beta fold hydrolase [Candidatus Dormibacteraeota bacterium]